MKLRFTSVFVGAAILLSMSACAPKAAPPSVADVTAQAQHAREANQKRIDDIRGNPALTDDQKADLIARIGRGRPAKP